MLNSSAARRRRCGAAAWGMVHSKATGTSLVTCASSMPWSDWSSQGRSATQRGGVRQEHHTLVGSAGVEDALNDPDVTKAVRRSYLRCSMPTLTCPVRAARRHSGHGGKPFCLDSIGV